jgi:hypothetical protein
MLCGDESLLELSTQTLEYQHKLKCAKCPKGKDKDQVT